MRDATKPDSAKHGTGVACDPEVLLGMIAQGDRSAFEEFYRVELPSVRGVIFMLVRDFHQAEEVAQEVMLQIWQLASRFDPHRGSALAWINKIARTRAIDRVRHSQAARLRDQWHSDHNHARSFDMVSEAALLHLDIEHIHRGLQFVTPLQREALVMAFFTDMTYAHIAVVLQVPLSTLKTRVRDGLVRMRKIIEEFDTREMVAA